MTADVTPDGFSPSTAVLVERLTVSDQFVFSEHMSSVVAIKYAVINSSLVNDFPYLVNKCIAQSFICCSFILDF